MTLIYGVIASHTGPLYTLLQSPPTANFIFCLFPFLFAEVKIN